MVKIKRIYDFVRRDIWRTTGDELDKTRRLGYATIKTLILSVRGFNDNDVSMRANALTYSFMFALVPILAMILAVARGFGMEQVIEGYLNKSFLGQYDPKIVGVIMGFVQRYLETAQGGVFLGIGILILLWAIYSFFRNVEASFNKIWQVNQSRNIGIQITNYLTLLLALPILMIASSGISIFVNTKLTETEFFINLGALYEWGLKLVPWMMSWLVFFLMYKGIPNTKVKWHAALIPGIFIGTLVQMLQMLTVYVIMFLGRTSVVYGAFAIIPLLLTWVQWLCMLILFGAELSYSIQNNEHFDYLQETDTMSRRYKDYLTLYICHAVIKRFEQGGAAYSAQELAQESHLPTRIVNQLLGRMADSKLLSVIRPESEHDDELRYQPAMDINKITVGMVFDQIEQQGTEMFFQRLPKEMNQFWKQFLQLRKEAKDDMNKLVKDL